MNCPFSSELCYQYGPTLIKFNFSVMFLVMRRLDVKCSSIWPNICLTIIILCQVRTNRWHKYYIKRWELCFNCNFNRDNVAFGKYFNFLNADIKSRWIQSFKGSYQFHIVCILGSPSKFREKKIRKCNFSDFFFLYFCLRKL